MTSKQILAAGIICIAASCTKSFDEQATFTASEQAQASVLNENPDNFVEISSIDLGDEGAAEISAYDPVAKKLFVVNNAGINKIDVVDLSHPSTPQYITSILLAPYGGLVNSLVAKAGRLAAAIEAPDKVSAGKVVVFSTADYTALKQVTVGSLPDMISESADGRFLVTANEGEPNSYNEANSVDPVGSVSIISVEDNFSVKTLDFSAFESKADDLKDKGLRIFGPNANFAQDIEPEYVAISEDSKTAWVTLQENNGIAKIDLLTKSITGIFPLGFKDFSKPRNAFDPSDEDHGFMPGTWPVKGIYQPDAIIVLEAKGIPFLFTANEGDARDYDGFAEETRIGDDAYILDAAAFPGAATLKADDQLGRLTVTNTLGDNDNDGDYDAIYTFGGRSFSIWNGNNGNLIYDCGTELEQQTAAAGFYDEGRSDNKGVEPEGVESGYVNKARLLFVGMERANAVAVYKLNSQLKPQFSHVLQTGEGPEGVLFVNRDQSPDNRSLLIISSEVDGTVKIFTPSAL